MPKINLEFLDATENEHFIQVKSVTVFDKKFVQINGETDEGYFHLLLDESTAIKFAKTVRTAINQIK